MKVTPQPTHGRPSYWVAKSVRSRFLVCGPGFRRIRSEDEFHPDEITEAAPAKEEKKTGATSASCADGRPARSSAQGRLHVLIAADNAGRADAAALKGQTAGAPFAAAIKKCAVTVCVLHVGVGEDAAIVARTA